MYDLEERTLRFARSVRDFVKLSPKTISNTQYAAQLIRSSASIGANYIEANEKLSSRDFAHRIRIAKKEAKETSYWLSLIEPSGAATDQHLALKNESRQLILILATILAKTGSK